jgi:hypothetical protein
MPILMEEVSLYSGTVLLDEPDPFFFASLIVDVTLIEMSISDGNFPFF